MRVYEKLAVLVENLNCYQFDSKKLAIINKRIEEMRLEVVAMFKLDSDHYPFFEDGLENDLKWEFHKKFPYSNPGFSFSFSIENENMENIIQGIDATPGKIQGVINVTPDFNLEQGSGQKIKIEMKVIDSDHCWIEHDRMDDIQDGFEPIGELKNKWDAALTQSSVSGENQFEPAKRENLEERLKDLGKWEVSFSSELHNVK